MYIVGMKSGIPFKIPTGGLCFPFIPDTEDLIRRLRNQNKELECTGGEECEILQRSFKKA